MKLKQAILQVLDRDGLKAMADGLEVEVADRRSAAELAAALGRSHRATAEVMLEYLSESAVKAVCEVYGIPTTGRRGKLVRALLRAERKAKARRQAARANTRPRAKTPGQLRWLRFDGQLKCLKVIGKGKVSW